MTAGPSAPEAALTGAGAAVAVAPPGHPGGLDGADGADEGPVFGFTVPDELLKEAVSKSRDREAVAGLDLVPGTGQGKPPPLMRILRENGFAGLTLLSAAAFVTGTFGNGISLLGPNIQASFHLSDAGLAR